MRRHISRSRKGFVLLSVLMMGVLVVSCAVSFSWFSRRQARTVGGSLRKITLRSMAHVIITSAVKMADELSSRTDFDSPVQRWYQPFVFDVPDAGICVLRITPLDDKIPLRNLFLPDGNTMRRELAEVWRDMWDKLGRRELEMTVLDFLDKNVRPRVTGREEDYYVNRPVYDISELMILSPDIDDDIMRGIDDYCTIYSDGKINLNVAPVHVMELIRGLDRNGIAEKIAEHRKEHGLSSLNDIRSIPGAGAGTSTQVMNIACFKSRYLAVKLECIQGSEGGALSYGCIYDRTGKRIVKWEEDFSE